MILDKQKHNGRPGPDRHSPDHRKDRSRSPRDNRSRNDYLTKADHDSSIHQYQNHENRYRDRGKDRDVERDRSGERHRDRDRDRHKR